MNFKIEMEGKFREFHLAIKQNNVEKVRQLLREGISPDEPNWAINGRPGILEAAYNGNLEIIKLLLGAGANPNAQNTLGETALHNAFHPKTFSKEICDLLMEHGANVNIRETLNGYTPLHLAAKLLSSKFSHAYKSQLLEVFKIMCEKTRSSNSNKSSRRETPMHRLVSGNVDCVEALQVLVDSSGCEQLDAQNDRGETSLMISIDKGHSNMAKLLVKAGACVNIKDRHFQTALHHCAQKNQHQLAKLLVEDLVEINATDLNGDTALHIAASKGLSDMVRTLISFPGIDVNVQNIRGATPLVNAVESGFTKVVELLLEAYSDSDYEKGLGNALEMAEDSFVKSWHPEIFSLLQKALEHKRDLWDEGETSL